MSNVNEKLARTCEPESLWLCYAVSEWREELANWSDRSAKPGTLRVQANRVSVGASFTDLIYFHARVNDEYLRQPLLQRALEFDQTMQALHIIGDIVPLRFQEPRTAGQLAHWLTTHIDQLLRTCRLLRGQSQINVRWTTNGSDVTQANTSSNTISGAEYLRSRARATQRERSLESELEELTWQLQTLVPGGSMRPRHAVRSIPAANLQIAGFDCLIARSMIQSALVYLRTLRFRGQLPTFVSGELAPFSFVEEELHLTEMPSQLSPDLQVQWCAKELVSPTSFHS